MTLQRDGATDLCGGSKRRKKVIEGGNCTQWSELPAVLLELILNQLGVIEFLMFACVCKSWRAVALAFKQQFMASQSPLVFLMSTNARKNGYFYNIFDERLYRAALPHLAGNKCLGFTCGYLVLSDSALTKKKENIWLVNPFTRHELQFPKPPKRYCHVILASLAKSDSQYVVVAFSRTHPFLQICRSGDVNWTVSEYDRDVWMIIDVSVFKGKIYVLTNRGQIGTLNLNSNPMVTLLHVKSVRIPSSIHTLHLVPSREELYVAAFCRFQGSVKIHKLDFERREWEKVKMNGEILFLGDTKCCGLSLPTASRDGFGEPLNRACYLGRDGGMLGGHTARYVAGKVNKPMQAIRKDGKPDIFISSPIWYFPHLSCSVNSVDED